MVPKMHQPYVLQSHRRIPSLQHDSPILGEEWGYPVIHSVHAGAHVLSRIGMTSIRISSFSRFAVGMTIAARTGLLNLNCTSSDSM